MRATFLLGPMMGVLLGACEGDLYRLEHDPAQSPRSDPDIAVPAAYRDLVNPLAGEPAAEVAGRTLFAARCASCHGDGGLGDGPRADGLSPAPADLTRTGDDSDGYLFWRVAEGGSREPFESRMPAFVDFLTEDESWQVISHLRVLADDASSGDGDPDTDEPPGAEPAGPGTARADADTP